MAIRTIGTSVKAAAIGILPIAPCWAYTMLPMK